MKVERFAIISCVIAALTVSSVAANAFEQQTPQAPAPAAPVATPVAPPSLSLDEKTKAAEPEKKGRGIKLPGFGKVSIPKLNFGLDLMYGSSDTKDTDLGFTTDPLLGEDNVTIRGKVKRKF